MRVLLNKKGLTLIEILVTVLIAAIIMGMIASIFGFFARFYTSENRQVNRQENMRILLLNLEKDIRMSDQEVDLTGTCYIIGSGADSTPSHEYCFDNINKIVSRNGNILARGVDIFTLKTTDDSYIAVNIQMIPDGDRKLVKATYTIYLRQAGN